MTLNAEKNYVYCIVLTTVVMESWANLNMHACMEMFIAMYVRG